MYNTETKEWMIDGVSAERRFGQFDMAKMFVECDFDVVRRVFSKVVPVKVDFDYASDSFKVYGMSHEFDPVPLGEPIPYYVVNIKRPDDPNDEVKVEFKRAS